MKKKIIAFTMLLLPLYSVAEDISQYELEWKDFAPVAYQDVQEPKGINKFNETMKYWYKRRVEFDSELEKCDAINGVEDKISCLQKLKVKQYQKNSDYNARIEAMENSQFGPQEMYDRTNNMLPINNYINQFQRMQQNEIQ